MIFQILHTERPGRAVMPNDFRPTRPSAYQESTNPEPREPQPEPRP